MSDDELALLRRVVDTVEDRKVAIVLLVLMGNAKAGVSQAPISELCIKIASQITTDLKERT